MAAKYYGTRPVNLMVRTVLNDPSSQQAIAKLEVRENTRCCLGHACHALGLERQIEMRENDVRNDVRITYDMHQHLLPPRAQKMLKLTERGKFSTPLSVSYVQNLVQRPIISWCESFKSLCNLNDRTDLTLAEIALVIEVERENLHKAYEEAEQ